MSVHEDRIARAIDKKATLERSLTQREALGVLIATGLLPPTADFTLLAARKVYNDVHRALAGMNFLQTAYEMSLTDHSIPQVAAIYPYVLKKEAEDVNVNVDFNPLEGMSEDERAAVRKFAANNLRMKLGLQDDE